MLLRPDLADRPVYIVDRKGRIVCCSQALFRLTGYPPSRLLGRLSVLLYVPEATPVFLMRRQRALRGQFVPSTLQTVLRTYSAEHIPVELTVETLRVEGKIAGRVAVVRELARDP